jgi:hypothetical protein
MNNIRVHFVANYASQDKLEYLRDLEWDEGIVACVTHTWVWPLYCRMKMKRYEVTISYNLEPDAINLIHSQTARKLFSPADIRRYFVIGIRADFRRFPYGQFEVVQNMHSEKEGSFYMPLYSQPGLMARDTSRTEVVNICFAGEVQNSVAMQHLTEEVKELGCRFVHKEKGAWHDLREIDILLGIRTFSKEPHHSKPPTKLFNAWLAGIPFIGGYDSAYEQVGIPGENYLRVASYEELLESIKRLKNDPDLYQGLVAAGKKAGESYTPDKITDMWVDFFEARVFPKYSQWRNGDLWLQLCAMVKSMLFRMEQLVREKINK